TAPRTQASPARPRQIVGRARQRPSDGNSSHEGGRQGRPPGGRASENRGNPGGSPDRARKALNAETIAELHKAFRRGGAKAIDKVWSRGDAHSDHASEHSPPAGQPRAR